MMAATREDIRGWIKRCQEEGATHMIVVCDTWDYEDYPVPVMPNEVVEERADYYRNASMQNVMEVYSFTGKHTIEDQMAERRAIHYD